MENGDVTTMTTAARPGRRPKTWLIIFGAGSVGLIAMLLLLSVVSGYGLNVRAFGSAVASLIRAVAGHSAVVATSGDYRNVVFLHHSVGRGLIEQGSMRELFTQAGYQFWDHDYNYPGLTDPTGQVLGYNYNVPADNTDPDGLLNIFTQPVYGLPINTLSGLMQHDVIMFKSCYPASNISTDEELEQRKSWYLKMRDFMDQHRDKIFVLVTPPPLNPAETSAAAAQRARAIATWLTSAEFLSGHSNLFTYDLFDRLAENDAAKVDVYMLRQDYRSGTDSHPTQVANERIGPDLVQFVVQSIDQYRHSRQ